MRKHGYEKKFSVGSVAGSSILGMLIPPSVLMILYGTASGTSIGHLFVAGVIPGIITTVIFMFTIWLTIKIKPDTVPNMGEAVKTMGRKERMSIILKPWPMILLILVSLGGIWMGYFTPTEAGGVAAFGALLLVIANKKFTPRGFLEVLRNAGVSTGSVMFLLITAQMYSRALAVSGAINLVEDSYPFAAYATDISCYYVYDYLPCAGMRTGFHLHCPALYAHYVPYYSKLWI